jgi:DNA-binding MarR family transcriptional regulator
MYMHMLPCLCASTRLAARAITRLYDSEFRSVGLQAPQFALLMQLAQKEGMSQVELLEDIAMDQTTLSRNLAVLVRRKWVKSEVQGRLRNYTVTRAGRAILERAKPGWKRAQNKMRDVLGADWDVVWSAVNRLAAAAESTKEMTG